MASQRSRTGSLPAVVGMIGLGVMGAPMARNLITAAAEDGTAVAVNHRSRDRVGELLDAGATWAATPRELAERSDILLLMLPDLPQVEEALAGADGIIAGIARPTTIIISSTSSATGIRELAIRLDAETNGLISLVDAPVSGGEDGAKAGTLSIMVGGEDDAVATAWPVLEAVGNPAHLGPLGSGAIAKFCNQLIVASTIMALGEAAVIAERSGIDLRALFDLLEGGYAGSRVLQTRKERIVTADYSPSGAAKYMVKDLTFAEEEAERTGTDAQLLRLLRGAFSDLTARGFGEQDISVSRAYVESRTPNVNSDSEQTP